jgi:hypothetical protein
MEKQVYEFTTTEGLILENSFGTIKGEYDVKLNVSIGINNDTYGWFELYDIETGGDEWYAEGGLWFNGKIVTMYDGVFALPKSVTDKLRELGFNVSEVE